MLLHTAPLAATAAALRSGQLDLLTYIDQVCDRLEQIDPVIQAFLPEPDRRARLRGDAERLAAQFPNPPSRPPLFGVAVGVKDIFHVDGFETRAGSLLPPDVLAGGEAAPVTALKRAGALVLGKTVTTEFAYFEPGPTRNPHHLDHTPGGSSSGSAAAVAAGLCPLALGTQTIGSIIRPAAFCGVVGFKPSFGRIRSSGVIYIAPSLDHVGMFAQDAAGIRLAASVLCEAWQDAMPDRLPVLGVPEGSYLSSVTAEASAAFEQQLGALERAGTTVRRVPALADIDAIQHHHLQLMSGEMARIHGDWFERYAPLYRPRTAAFIRQGQGVDETALSAARAYQQQTCAELEALMRTADIDLWVSPSAPGAAPLGIEKTGDPVMSFPWTFAGLPTVTLPAGMNPQGLPLGLQFVAPFGGDERLLAWAQRLAEILAAVAIDRADESESLSSGE